MIKKVIYGDIEIKLLAVLFIAVLCATYSPLSHANEEIEPVVDKASYIEIELMPDLVDVYSGPEFIYAKSAATKYETKPLEKEAILRTIPSITTDDNKTLGLIIPPFAYFAKKF